MVNDCVHLTNGQSVAWGLVILEGCKVRIKCNVGELMMMLSKRVSESRKLDETRTKRPRQERKGDQATKHKCKSHGTRHSRECREHAMHDVPLKQEARVPGVSSGKVWSY